MNKVINHLKFRYRQVKRNYEAKYVIPPYEEKRAILRSYKDKYSCKVFVETGTFMGDTVEALKEDFEKLISIELQEDLAKNAQARFEGQDKIKIYQGDSATVLKQVIENDLSDQTTLFWLDGHYSSEFAINGKHIVTAKGEKDTPIFEELENVLKDGIGKHVILIDDARCFTGEGDYPSKKVLFDFLGNKGIKRSQISVQRDLIRIVPN